MMLYPTWYGFETVEFGGCELAHLVCIYKTSKMRNKRNSNQARALLKRSNMGTNQWMDKLTNRPTDGQSLL
jgi:hypothetical protein